eukprot:2258028-Amphidinium_carterae.4
MSTESASKADWLRLSQRSRLVLHAGTCVPERTGLERTCHRQVWLINRSASGLASSVTGSGVAGLSAHVGAVASKVAGGVAECSESCDVATTVGGGKKGGRWRAELSAGHIGLTGKTGLASKPVWRRRRRRARSWHCWRRSSRNSWQPERMTRPWATRNKADSWGMHTQRCRIIGTCANGFPEEDCVAVGFWGKIQAVLVEPMF